VTDGDLDFVGATKGICGKLMTCLKEFQASLPAEFHLDSPELTWRAIVDSSMLLMLPTFLPVVEVVAVLLTNLVRDHVLKPIAKWIGKHVKTVGSELVNALPPAAGAPSAPKSGIAFVDMFNKVVDRLTAAKHVSRSERDATQLVISHFAQTIRSRLVSEKVIMRF
jgi:hypothetical protein